MMILSDKAKVRYPMVMSIIQRIHYPFLALLGFSVPNRIVVALLY